MAKLHSKKRGKSSPKRPKALTNPEWVKASKDEVLKKLVTMSKTGTTKTRIGLLLRDTMGVPSAKAFFGVRLGSALAKEGVTQEYPEDLLNLIKRAVRIRNHLKQSKKDVHNKVKLLHTESKINRLVKYYVRTGKLPADWKYDPEKAVLLVK